jgi:hypothetical protein
LCRYLYFHLLRNLLKLLLRLLVILHHGLRELLHLLILRLLLDLLTLLNLELIVGRGFPDEPLIGITVGVFAADSGGTLLCPLLRALGGIPSLAPGLLGGLLRLIGWISSARDRTESKGGGKNGGGKSDGFLHDNPHFNKVSGKICDRRKHRVNSIAQPVKNNVVHNVSDNLLVKPSAFNETFHTGR